LEKFAKGDDIIIVHNGVNPLPSTDEISKTIAGAKSKGACISGHFVTSTIKEVGEEHIIKTHDRKQLFAAETPQAARIILLQKAVRNAKEKKLEVTDEAMMLEAIGQRVAIVEAHENNFKITSQADYAKLRSIVGDFPDDFRVGIGQDSHMFEVSKKGLFLGGVSLPNEPKLKANSDGDVILHAIFNAISQAIGENSIGFYADVECEKGIKDSKKYLEPLLKKMEKQGFEINSLGIMVECKNPKIDPLVPKIKKSLKEIFNIPSQRIGITATSGEECTVFGEGLGMQCFAIVSLKKS
jgi:2-C-methyl-D-erythritol 4-phosphate cytidylyltransferase/2-C-methyl-D-erythritol 4-phosphate cytidylyltransferase/2-C-methyl-D-erythritol 2,4-cyclodiphosphate synthase